MIGVVDTSALIRLFVPDGPMAEGFDDFLRGVERGINTAIAPELLMAEAANVINKKQLSGELSGDESLRLLADLLSVPIRLFSHRPLILPAFELAGQYQLTVYDALYLALAKEHGAVIFTADSKLTKTAEDLRLR
jgi:predicted nucleic acid-binding protein